MMKTDIAIIYTIFCQGLIVLPYLFISLIILINRLYKAFHVDLQSDKYSVKIKDKAFFLFQDQRRRRREGFIN